jgi:hypothetical protein
MLFDLNKKGTLIVTIGRSGSHLLGDVISNQLVSLGIQHTNHKEYFLKHNGPLDWPGHHNFYKSKISRLLKDTAYTICQIQDFYSKVYLSKHYKELFDQYHIVVLERQDQLVHFFSKQLLHNFHNVIPTHTINGINDNFDLLKNQSKIKISIDDVFQFYSEKLLLDLFDRDVTVVYEDMILWEEVVKSKYKKNQYPVSFDQLFDNFEEIADLFNSPIAHI